MQKLSRIFILFVLCTLYYVLQPTDASAQVPQIRYPCEKPGLSPEFHSLRPYQAAPCGDANKAEMCSNDLKFLETFDVTGMKSSSGGIDCIAREEDGTFTCNPDLKVKAHTLIVELDNSMFPIMGNTENEFDDATKVNEYASWYLSGVNNRAEYGENTDDRVVNYSGPVQKLLPKMIQEAERIKTIDKATINDKPWTDEDDGITYTTPQNHDQVVVCGKEVGFGWLGNFLDIGVTKPVPCYEDKEYRLSKWLGDLSDFNGLFNRIGTDIWNKRTPPLPWADKDNKPFESQTKYQKAYNEWKGQTCATIPLIDINLCIENPFVPNKWADLYSYIPLSNTTDKKGAERVMDVQPHPSNGTAIEGFSYGEVRSAPLYFAHTQEVKELSELLNKTFTPLDCPVDEKGKRIADEECKLLKNKRGNIEKNDCKAVNIRVNQGDNLFPGDPDEIQVPEVAYTITEAQCVEKYKYEEWCNEPAHPNRCSPDDCCEKPRGNSIKCTAEVEIVLKTKTKTPNADEIFDSTVAGTGSTFRKIFPKVQDGAPVSCIADMPTVTDVTYTATNTLKGGDSEFSVKRYPEDGAGSNPQLTFPHVGSVYEYFLKGIQTALRPKGYGEPITSGALCNNIKCGDLGNLPQASGSCKLGGISARIGEIPQTLNDIISAASQTYKVPPNLILGIMFGEGLFNPGRFDWTDENVKNWATCEPIPDCNESGDDNFMGFNGDVFQTISGRPDFTSALQKIDPGRKTFSQCNLLDSIFAIAQNSNYVVAQGGMAFRCFNLSLATSAPSDCNWNNNQLAAAIKIAENGYDQGCFTLENSCATGGGNAALCTNGTDGCETIGNRYQSTPSHMGCVFDVAHGN